MRLKRRKIGYMAIKIDLEKAYDRLEWPFIDDTLKELRIPDKLRILIMRCVSSVSTQVLWNGAMSTSFNPSRGLRQGDPLSPYLFVMCMERLGHAIAGAVNNSRWKPIRLCRNEPVLSHLFFAYDLEWLSDVGPLASFVVNIVERDNLPRQSVSSMSVDRNFSVKSAYELRRGILNDDTHKVWESEYDDIWPQLATVEFMDRRLEDFCTRDIKNWMQINITSPGFYAREDNDWDLQFGSILWLIWKHRNGRIFDLDYFEHESVLEKSRRLTLEANRAMESSLPTIHLSHRPCTIHDAWQPPPHNWCKINTYASCNIRSGFASCGGVFRSSNGGWMFGFSKVIGICSIVEVELWGIHEGLSHAWNLGERLITVETDSLEAVRMLKHISRNANKVMDRLAKIVATRGEVHMVFSTPPLEVIDFIQQEAEDYTLTA
ncbi:hypothetical protein F3Y22_tig00004045pilonHSYRG00033 [Hibiscus syriacus]|uniref:Reverse transcriptase domain-containing protein n=1 Tax=Hibiscus syriacus TaxID=106335 RepID=A0A6A3CIB5_HIBSY|nr:hypothetical protein F3Y22_tig00004045pilonHSYRG00033 [Hibiscus syriacus]